MRELLEKMRSGSCDSPIIENKLLKLSQSLENVKGKKVYGYLKKPVKAQVDDIVDELAKLPEVAECYEVWNGLRDELESYYKDAPRQRLPLSQQKEFRTIKNLVIQEAELPYDDDVTQAEKREAVKTLEQLWDKGFTSAVYHLGRTYRDGLGVLPDDEKVEYWLTLSAMQGNAFAQFLLDHRQHDPSVLLCTVRLLI